MESIVPPTSQTQTISTRPRIIKLIIAYWVFSLIVLVVVNLFSILVTFLSFPFATADLSISLFFLTVLLIIFDFIQVVALLKRKAWVRHILAAGFVFNFVYLFSKKSATITEYVGIIITALILYYLYFSKGSKDYFESVLIKPSSSNRRRYSIITVGIIVAILGVLFYLFFYIPPYQINTQKIADYVSEKGISIEKHTGSLEDPRLYASCSDGGCDMEYRNTHINLTQRGDGRSASLLISTESGQELVRRDFQKEYFGEWHMFAVGNDVIIYAAPDKYYSGILHYRIQENQLETISSPRGFNLLMDINCKFPRNNPAEIVNGPNFIDVACRDHSVFIRDHYLVALGDGGKLLIYNLITSKYRISKILGNPLLKVRQIFIAQDNTFYLYESEDVFGAEVRKGNLDFAKLDI